MKNKGINWTIIVACTGMFLGCASWNDTTGLNPEIVTESKYAMGNEAVHMVGCQALPKSDTPRIIRPPVVKTFVSLPCATEVPPPAEAVEHKKRSRDEK